MKEKRVRSIFLRSISSTSELVGKCATRKPKLGFLWNFWCHSYFPLETAPRSAQFTPLLPLLREIIKAEWCQIVNLNVYVLYHERGQGPSINLVVSKSAFFIFACVLLFFSLSINTWGMGLDLLCHNFTCFGYTMITNLQKTLDKLIFSNFY